MVLCRFQFKDIQLIKTFKIKLIKQVMRSDNVSFSRKILLNYNILCEQTLGSYMMNQLITQGIIQRKDNPEGLSYVLHITLNKPK